MGCCQSTGSSSADYSDLSGTQVRGEKISASELQRRVQHATKTCSLKLHACRLQEIPSGVTTSSAWKLIDLAYNSISALPEELSTCSKLRTLAVPHNHITTIGCNFDQMTSLRRLDVSFNPICSIPMLPGSLTELDVSGCRELDIAALGRALVPCYSTLQSISLRGCNLETLPSWIVNLTALIVLDVSDCAALASLELPAGTSWSALSSLAQLRAAGCPALAEHGDLSKSLLEDSSVHTLVLTGSGFTQSGLQRMPGMQAYIQRHTARADKAMSGGGAASTTLCQV